MLAAPRRRGRAAASAVLAIELDNDINPVTADFVVEELERANAEEFDAAVIVLDTPGGLSSSMEEIYKAELASEIPVVVYVAPDGASATSAGVFVAQAADILAMAPSTTIGSSTPITGTGQDLDEDLRRKAVNSFASTLRTLAERHGRNGDWAEAAVREASNLTETEALEMNVIDLIAPSLPVLLDEIDGMEADGKPIHTAGAEIEEVALSGWKRILDLLVDPNVIALLLSIGTLGIIVELWNPGLVFPGTVGAISLILALLGASVLPISWAGRPADVARGDLLRRRGVRRQPRGADRRGRRRFRLRRPDPVRPGRAELPGLAVGRAGDRADALALHVLRRREARAGPTPPARDRRAGHGRHARGRRPRRLGARARRALARDGG